MSSSPHSETWSPGTLYKVTLTEPHPDAVLYGFRNDGMWQLRYFMSQERIDDYLGELWMYGITGVRVEEYQEE